MEDENDFQQLFQIAEMNGRNLFNYFKNRKQDFELFFSNPVKGEKHDGYLISGTSLVKLWALFEVKKRNCTLTFYPSARLEKDKYDYLTERVVRKEEGRILKVQPWYINIYEDGYIAVFNLNEITPEWSLKWCPKESMSGQSEWVQKWCYDIPFDKAVIYHLNYELYN
jgi:hypothetical protein